MFYNFTWFYGLIFIYFYKWFKNILLYREVYKYPLPSSLFFLFDFSHRKILEVIGKFWKSDFYVWKFTDSCIIKDGFFFLLHK